MRTEEFEPPLLAGFTGWADYYFDIHEVDMAFIDPPLVRAVASVSGLLLRTTTKLEFEYGLLALDSLRRREQIRITLAPSAYHRRPAAYNARVDVPLVREDVSVGTGEPK